MSFALGYNTNGFAHHRLTDAIDIIADIGYQAVAITLDHHSLNPLGSADLEREIDAVRDQLERRKLRCVVETGARFLLHARRKHWPTLVSREPRQRACRIHFLACSIEIASRLGAEAVSFWSGTADPDLPVNDAWRFLVHGCRELVHRAAQHDMRLAFEPEPGMMIERLDDFDRLAAEIDDPRFGLTLDLGHVYCLDDGDPAARIRQYADRLFNVHIEDMRAGMHEHLMFGEGEMRFEPIVEALGAVGYGGTVNVELSRHSHDAVNTARAAFHVLSQFGADMTPPS